MLIFSYFIPNEYEDIIIKSKFLGLYNVIRNFSYLLYNESVKGSAVLTSPLKYSLFFS